jgi:hypothetical protein
MANSDLDQHPVYREASAEAPKPAVSEARLHANRENAQHSTGPRTGEGKKRSSLNSTRHGILAQVIHLPEEEMAAFSAFTKEYVASLAPIGAVEIQLANACADLQFRLHRLAAAEHNLFAIGHNENGDAWDVDNAESHTALAFAETLRRSKDPLALLTLYESRLSRRLLQTLKQLREIQAERRALEQQQLEELYLIAAINPDLAKTIEPSALGFVCSASDWRRFYRRKQLINRLPGSSKTTKPIAA